MPKIKLKPLSAEVLRASCDPSVFGFMTTEELPDLAEFLGQTRALKAAEFGIGIKREGFNIYALGPAGIGKRTIFRTVLEKEARNKATPPDICYVHNFKNSRHPAVMLLEPGLGKRLKEDMHALIEILHISIPALFESETYRAKIKEIQENTQEKQQEAFKILEQKAEDQGLTILRTNQGLALGATKEGKILSEEEFAALPKEEKNATEKQMQELHDEIAGFLEKLATWHKEERQKTKEALKYFTMMEVESAITDVKKKYQNNPTISSYLTEVQQAIIENPNDFRKEEGISSILPFGGTKSSFNHYKINILVDNSELKGAPIIYEDNPNFSNLVGHIDQISQFGALFTDFTLIRAGALHKANGGYLLIDALKLLQQPFAYEALKRALKSKVVRLENVGQLMGFIATVTLEPDPVPIDLKVILLGERYIYYLLCAADPEFPELFKVAADFDDDIERNSENQLLFAQLLKSLTKKDHLKALDKSAVARMVEYSSRLASDTKKMSTHIGSLADILREADYWATQEKSPSITMTHIEKAIEEQKYRESRIKDQFHEHIARGILLIETTGEKIGQINGISRIEIGTSAFGQPACITARVHKGNGELLDIERMVKLGGPIHSKGVMILTGYIAGHYAPNHVLSLSGSLVFEQSYGEVEGDSASAAEACVLLSAIGEIPLKQSLAITGSINQHGQIQAVGGTNEKIEGFFDICKERGLTGDQGVIIPSSNVDRLMLRKDVVEAARAGLFNLYAVNTIDEAMEILTGLKAGTRDSKGNFPKNSINYNVEERLLSFAKRKQSRKISK